MELMDPANPGHQQAIDDGARVEPEDAGSVPRQPGLAFLRMRRTCRAIATPISHGFKAAKQKLKEPRDDKVGWKRTVFVLLTEQVGLALGLAPYVYNELGYIGATLMYAGVACLGYYTNMILFRFKRDNESVTSICDVAGIVYGEVGKIVTLMLFALCATVGIPFFLHNSILVCKLNIFVDAHCCPYS